jgi:hypothetical protein
LFALGGADGEVFPPGDGTDGLLLPDGAAGDVLLTAGGDEVVLPPDGTEGEVLEPDE